MSARYCLAVLRQTFLACSFGGAVMAAVGCSVVNNGTTQFVHVRSTPRNAVCVDTSSHSTRTSVSRGIDITVWRSG